MRARNVEFDVVEYLKTPLSEAMLRKFLALLSCDPKDLLHPSSFENLGRDIDDYNTPDALVKLLLEYPEVMNRPVCIHGNRAVIARPAEAVADILD